MTLLAKLLVRESSGRNDVSVLPPVRRKKCLGLEAERGTWDGPHMKDPAEIFALITASPTGRNHSMSVLLESQAASLFVCFTLLFWQMIVSLLVAVFSSACPSHLTWWTCSYGWVETGLAEMTDLETISWFSVIGVTLILLMAVSGNKEIPH